jgi:hypothetical protein
VSGNPVKAAGYFPNLFLQDKPDQNKAGEIIVKTPRARTFRPASIFPFGFRAML